MTVEVALIISVLSCGFSIFFGMKNNKRSDSTDVANRVAEITRLEVKIDSLLLSMDEFKSELKNQRTEINNITKELVELKASAKQAHKRIDSLETRI